MYFQGGDSYYDQQTQENGRRTHQSDKITQNKNLDDSFNDDDEAYGKKVQAQMDKDVRYRQDLKQQCEENVQRSQHRYEESHVEMRSMQEVQRETVEEYQRECQDQYNETQKLHKDIEAFKKDCNDYKDMQRALIDLEENRIDGQSHEISDRDLVVQQERDRKLKEKQDLNEKMCSEMMADEVDRQQQEDMVEIKHETEEREKVRREDMKVQEKHEEDRRELRQGLLTQIEENKQSVRDEKQREVLYRDQACAIMELEDEREKERARKKKEADDQYYADLRQQIADNAVRRQKEKELDAM
ncbi:unnamed protein product [Leptosia nina]|uniref:Trichohyalin-plectin-homology domain-containing protein n=1 Tax=Leptosia nina TaxID=320188 RepID=A0AAV1JAC6_9NEOP